MPLRCHKTTTMNLGWTPRKHGSFVASMPGCSLSRLVREEAVLCALVTNPVCCVLCVHACGGHGVWCRHESACDAHPGKLVHCNQQGSAGYVARMRNTMPCQDLTFVACGGRSCGITSA